MTSLTVKDLLPEDGTKGTLVGRVWLPQADGPSVVAVRADGVFDITRSFPTVARSARRPTRPRRLRAANGRADRRSRSHPGQHAARWARPEQALAARADRPPGREGGGRHLRHLDAGARDRGAGPRQSGLRAKRSARKWTRLIGDDLSKLKPGSPQAMQLKQVLIDQSAWSQYLEVGIGPDAEVFTKAPTMSVGRHRHGCRAASEVDLEQSRAGSRAGRRRAAAASSARRSATT